MSASKQEKRRLDYRVPDFSIAEVELLFQLEPENTKVVSRMKIRRQGTADSPLILDGEKLRLASVEVDGKPWPYVQDETSLRLENVPDDFELKIENFIDPAGNTEFEGLYMSEGAFCTQCEAEGFRKITYYLDRPDVSAKFTTRIEADKKLYPHLLSNGNRVEAGDLPGGRHYVVRQDPFSKPCYLFALVAGNFDVLEDRYTTASGRQVEIQLFVQPGAGCRGHHALESIKRAMAWDEKRFGLEYDLDLFQVVAVDFFNMGAMENKGLNIFNSKFVLADAKTGTDDDFHAIENVIGHEYFHNWTGDRVTCRDWFQLSLKEGLTVFRDQEFSSDLHSRPVERIDEAEFIRTVQFAEDAGPMSHPIRPDRVIEQNNFYTVTVYEKGAEVIRMLHTIIGEENFQKGMKLYISRHDGTCATCEDFVRAMEDASGCDLKQFRHWYECDGTPEVTVTQSYDASARRFAVRFVQSHRSSAYADRSSYPPMVIPLKLEVIESSSLKTLAPQDRRISESGVLLLKDAETEIVYENVSSRPVICCLSDFSAPVDLKISYSAEDLRTVIAGSGNDFNRYDAMWAFYTRYFQAAIDGRVQEAQSVARDLAGLFETIVSSDRYDGLYLARLLAVPSTPQILRMFDRYEVEAAHEAREKLRRHLASALDPLWLKLYQRHDSHEAYVWDHEHSCSRKLKHLAMSYLALGRGEDFGCELVRQYESADNMTDQLAAFSIAVHADLDAGKKLAGRFREQWHGNGLIMDKWFRTLATVASDRTLDRVKDLMNDPDFTMSNPNRIRSLIGSFVAGNPYGFHIRGSESYDFLTEILTDLNTRNPQTAARLIDVYLDYDRYPAARSQEIRRQLEKLSALDGLASDLYEKIKRALKQI